MGPHPIVGGIVQASSGPVFGRWVSYPSPPWRGVVLLVAQGWCLTGPRWLLSPRSLQGQCSMLASVRAGTPSCARPPPSLSGVVMGRGRASCECRVLRRVEEVGDDPGLGGWPAPLGFHWATVVRAFVGLLYCRPRGLLTNRCLGIPRCHDPDSPDRCLRFTELNHRPLFPYLRILRS